jgi:hypothetical protein
MTFKDALHTLSTNLVLKLAVPLWAKNLTKRSKKVNMAFMELKVRYYKPSDSSKRACLIRASCLEQQYMLEMVEVRRNAEKVEQCHDLFSGLLDAAQDEQGDEAALSDDELVGGYSSSRLSDILLKSDFLILPGNMFIFLFAGHEVGPFPSCGASPKRFSTDHSAHAMLLACPVGSIS